MCDLSSAHNFLHSRSYVEIFASDIGSEQLVVAISYNRYNMSLQVVDKICHYQRNLEKCGDNEARVRMIEWRYRNIRCAIIQVNSY